MPISREQVLLAEARIIEYYPLYKISCFNLFCCHKKIPKKREEENENPHYIPK